MDALDTLHETGSFTDKEKYEILRIKLKYWGKSLTILFSP